MIGVFSTIKKTALYLMNLYPVEMLFLFVKQVVVPKSYENNPPSPSNRIV